MPFAVHASATVRALTIAPPTPVSVPKVVERQQAKPEIFVCSEESDFYSQCIEQLLLRKCHGDETVIEFGSGDGTPVINSLLQHSSTQPAFTGSIHGYELNSTAAGIATRLTAQRDLHQTYQVHNSCFFEGVRRLQASHLIGNPPYIPAPDDNILMPALYGGTDGSNLTRDLMSLGFEHAVLLVSAYCDPVRTLRHAQRLGYHCTDFVVTSLPFGTYSSEPKVRSWIEKMKADGRAFCGKTSYKLAGVQLQKQPQTSNGSAVEPDCTDELLSILTAS